MGARIRGTFPLLAVLVFGGAMVVPPVVFGDYIHYTNGYRHGIASSGCPARYQDCSLEAYISDYDGGSNMDSTVRMVHVPDPCCGVVQQCWSYVINDNVNYCWGSSGNHPCQKYAEIGPAYDPGEQLAKHSHQLEIC